MIDRGPHRPRGSTSIGAIGDGRLSSKLDGLRLVSAPMLPEPRVGRLIGRGCMTSPIPHRSQPALRSGRSPRRGQRPWPTRGEHINNRFNCRQAGVDQSVRGRVSGWVRAESRCHVVSEPHSDTQELRSEQPVVKCIWVGPDPLVGFHQRTQLGD